MYIVVYYAAFKVKEILSFTTWRTLNELSEVHQDKNEVVSLFTNASVQFPNKSFWQNFTFTHKSVFVT